MKTCSIVVAAISMAAFTTQSAMAAEKQCTTKKVLDIYQDAVDYADQQCDNFDAEDVMDAFSNLICDADGGKKEAPSKRALSETPLVR